ncbi:MAG TPA: threonine--tRNA ligase [Spirochaetota bacterium]|jgi:threonyl-tRNA synthetase|nr:MAG: Threonine--tRNA ligase 2 [Spirochaetes bacterium ADurb.Bin133]HNZ26816.1 threonine--tRNA ligase [Spirochaetota bacterium]HPY87493.1 threonine--tRNA ligase [Spirochaetota bacterium]HQB60704.1 threonine--tRNA ligase [Spirochaetota bacterium]
MDISVTINDKSYALESGKTLFDLVMKNFPGAKSNFLAAEADGNTIELFEPINADINIKWITAASDEGLRILRHSASHIMALAVKRLFPGTLIAIGPSTDDGFYYDFDSHTRFNEEDFVRIEEEMQKIIDADVKFIKASVSKEEALKMFENQGEVYKTELIGELQDGSITLYTSGEFTDLCKGPHVPSSGYIKAFKLMKIAGAYWRGDEKNKMLQRIYGTAYADSKSLKAYLRFLEEAMERDHRKIGKEMGLFGFYPEGPGFPFWKPAGMALYNNIMDYWKRVHRDAGYFEVKTPIILNEELWHRSGHWDNYKENMYFTEIDETKYAVKPMNCPGGLLIFRDGIHSYKELPLKIAELGLVHRHEKSGVLHGLMRVRQFTQDDAHIYCSEDQVKEEVIKVIELIKKIYSDFGFNDVAIELSTRPEKSIGSDAMWELAEDSLKNALTELNINYKINPGDGAFYGPKIDFHIRDAIGRSWQCGTIQCDFAMPERFDISYVGKDGLKRRPVMLHRAILGSCERFIGILIEHYKGKFPFWLAPEQIRLLPLSENHFAFADEIKNMLQKQNITITVDKSLDKLGGKIKNARLERVCYLGVIGDKEVQNRTMTVRKADGEDNIEVSFDNLVNFFVDIRDKKK